MKEKTKKKHKNPFQMFIQWIKDEHAEAKKISWPTMKETFKHFMTVCLFTITMTFIYTCFDSIISLMIQILGGGF